MREKVGEVGRLVGKELVEERVGKEKCRRRSWATSCDSTVTRLILSILSEIFLLRPLARCDSAVLQNYHHEISLQSELPIGALLIEKQAII